MLPFAGVIGLAAVEILTGIAAVMSRVHTGIKSGKETGVTETAAVIEIAVVTEGVVVQGTDDCVSGVQQLLYMYNQWANWYLVYSQQTFLLAVCAYMQLGNVLICLHMASRGLLTWCSRTCKQQYRLPNGGPVCNDEHI